jgi:hypothetical protein
VNGPTGRGALGLALAAASRDGHARFTGMHVRRTGAPGPALASRLLAGPLGLRPDRQGPDVEARPAPRLRATSLRAPRLSRFASARCRTRPALPASRAGAQRLEAPAGDPAPRNRRCITLRAPQHAGELYAADGGDVWLAEHKNRPPPTGAHRTRSGGLLTPTDGVFVAAFENPALFACHVLDDSFL